MEKAVLISSLKGIKHLHSGYSRVYFGNEFCQYLLPTVNALRGMMHIVQRKRMKFTLVTPYLTNAGQERLKLLLDWLDKHNEKYEVVVNDWGLLKIINEKYHNFQPVLGRLLHKLKRGPQIMGVMKKLSQPALDHFKGSNVSMRWFRQFLHSNRIKRVAFDNLVQGINVDLNSGGFPLKGSLYFPYVYVSTTRVCLVNGCEVQKKSDRVGIFPCRKECKKYTFYLKNKDMPVTLILKGNTQFFINDKLPQNLESIGIDRIVEQPRFT